MPDVQPLNDDERAELVAYLDGELDEKSARAVEAKLNRDPRVRAEADALRRAWNLLDYLPRPEPSPNFTQRTVASIAQPTLRVRRWKSWLLGAGWAAAVFVAGVIGYVSMSGHSGTACTTDSKPEDTEQLARDLHVIDQVRQYQNVGDISFLNELDRPELFGDDQAGH
jgi:anti-sigma factor RsiW